jgi:translation initiation factor IF-3
MDYGKYRYEQTKRERETHKKHQSGKLKEIRIRPFIEHHDYNVKLEQAKEFLHKKCKVKLSMFFRGREIVHKDSGMDLLNKFVDDLKEFGAVESPPKTLGKLVLVTLGPVSSKHAAKKKDETETGPEKTETINQ